MAFRYHQAETRTWIRAPDYLNLFENVRDHRKANNLPLGTFWEREVEDQLCQMLPPGLCKQEDPAKGRSVFTRIGWDQVVAGTSTIVSWATTGFRAVSQELANARADTCSRCYFNVSIGGLCGGCGHLSNLAAQFGKGKTPADPFLKACSVCQCSLLVKIWVPIEAIDKGTPPQMFEKFPSFCWIKKELGELRTR